MRLVRFGAGLNPEPITVETDDDLWRMDTQDLLEWASPGYSVRKLVNGEQMETWERQSAERTEEVLKAELDRLHQELQRRVPTGASSLLRSSLVVGVIAGVVATIAGGLILFYVFGIGR
jgi:hypothetical protein